MNDEGGAALDGRLELKGLLGAGGMGEVHRGWDRGLERAVAVKFFRGPEPRDAERLLLEGRLQARVDHPHVVRVLAAGSIQKRPCLVMQLVEGRSLDAAAPGLSIDQRVELVRQAALGIHAAHLEGLVHRDVKPGNVLIEEGPGAPRALVSDFGLARGDEPGLTRSGFAPGTLAYMSPEQLTGEPIGFAADVYGLGATLYTVLAGHPPRGSTPASTECAATDSRATFLQWLETSAPPLPSDVPRPLARVVNKAMERRPSARYESAEAFAADLERYQRGEPVSARPPTLAERAAAWRRRHRAFSSAVVVVALVLVGAVVWGGWRARRADAEALEAARLGALGEAMEADLRAESLSPPHDLRPALAKVRAQVEALRPQAAQGGAASFALGKGLELLGDVDGARTAYQHAWDKGFRLPRVAEGLGNALAEQYRLAYQRAYETLEPSARVARLEALRVELREPAIRFLTLADSGGWRTDLLQSSIALLEGDAPGVRAHAEAVLAAEPGRYEALVLQARSHLEQARQLEADGQLDRSVAEADDAVQLLTRAATWGRSDFTVAKTMAFALVARFAPLGYRGELPPDRVAAADEAVARAAVLAPDDPALLELRAAILTERQYHAFQTGSAAEVVRMARESAQLYRQLIERSPRDVKALCGLGRMLYQEAFNLTRQGEEPFLQIKEGLQVLERAAALAPSDPTVYRTRLMLHSMEARLLIGLGQPAERALRAWIEAGEEAIRLGVRQTAATKCDLGEARISLGVDLWRSARDPRPEFERGLALMEEAMQALPGQVRVVDEAANAYAKVGEVLNSMGAGGWSRFARAKALMRELAAARPGVYAVEATLGQVLLLEAMQRAAFGLDPRPQVEEVRKLLGPSSHSSGNLEAEIYVAALPVIEASWEQRQGRTPVALVRRAQRQLRGILQRNPNETDAWFFLAEAARIEGLWLKRSGHEATEVARSGLEALSHAADRDPDHWALKARLLSLAGDRTAAVAALDRAWALNPLFKGGVVSKEVEAEILAAAGTPSFP